MLNENNKTMTNLEITLAQIERNEVLLVKLAAIQEEAKALVEMTNNKGY